MPRTNTASMVLEVLHQLGIDVTEDQVAQALTRAKTRTLQNVTITEGATAVTITLSVEEFTKLQQSLPSLPVLKVTQVGTRKRKK